MRYYLTIASAAAILVYLAAATHDAHGGPFDGKAFQGRIAYSADGNHNDEDDWPASPLALAIFARCGLQEKLVHFDYNSILLKTDPDWEREHALGVLGAAQRYGYPKGAFYDCQKDLHGAIESIRRAVNASSANDPLYFIVAGPVDVPYLGIERSEPGKRQYVYCVSHHWWNDGFAGVEFVRRQKRDVIELGVNWVQIGDQNVLLSSRPAALARGQADLRAIPEDWVRWHWMRDSSDANVRFLWDRMRSTERGRHGAADCSDAGMAYFLVSGDEGVDALKLKRLVEEGVVPTPIAARTAIRMEAENFRCLDAVHFVIDRTASQRCSAHRSGAATARIRTAMDEPYTAASADYDVVVRYAGEEGGPCRFRLFVNDRPRGAAWNTAAGDRTWRSRTIRGVTLAAGDEIMVEINGDFGGRLDYVQFNAAEPPAAVRDE